MPRIVLGLIAALGISSLLPLSAGAIGLDVLAGGGSLSSGNGLLTFSEFEVVTTGSVRSDLSLYDVSALSAGLALTGPISATGGRSGDLFLAFTVRSTVPILGVGLSFNGAATGRGSLASVVETAEGIAGDQAFVYATGGGLLKLIDSIELPGVDTIRLAKDILVDARHYKWLAPRRGPRCHPKRGKGSGLAVISRVEQSFVLDEGQAPEPAAGLLLLVGLAGLVGIRRR